MLNKFTGIQCDTCQSQPPRDQYFLDRCLVYTSEINRFPTMVLFFMFVLYWILVFQDLVQTRFTVYKVLVCQHVRTTTRTIKHIQCTVYKVLVCQHIRTTTRTIKHIQYTVYKVLVCQHVRTTTRSIKHIQYTVYKVLVCQHVRTTTRTINTYNTLYIKFWYVNT